jgi:glycosyltransferase involved in cell wall biosynthesis
MRFKIAFDAKRIFNNLTGLGNYSRTLVKNIVEAYPEHEYHLFTPSIKDSSETKYFLTDRFVVHTPKIKLLGSIWRSTFIPSIIKKKKINIYHGLSHELPLFNIDKACKTVLTIHDLIYELYPNQFPLLDRLGYQIKYKKSINKADKIVAISESTKADLVNLYGTHESKINVIYQAANTYFKPAKIIKPLKERDYFLFVGSIIERKGVDKLISVYEQHPDLAQLKLIGGGGEYKQKMQSKVQSLNLEHKIEFVNQVSNLELLQYYQNAIATILISQYEGFGIPMIESLLCKTPVITSNISSLPEACGPGGILVNPDDISALHDAMVNIQDLDMWSKLQSNGNEHVISNFEGVALAHRMMKLYKSL